MDELGWHSEDNPVALLLAGGIPGECRPSQRKLRLFLCAAARTCWDILPEEARRAIVLAERVADGDISIEEAREKDGGRRFMGGRHARFEKLGQESSQAVRAAAFCLGDCAGSIAFDAALTALSSLTPPSPLADCYREIVDNPFRPHPFYLKRCPRCDGSGKLGGNPTGPTCTGCSGLGNHMTEPNWITPQVRDIARAAYDRRNERNELDAPALAVLSDALEEAGCVETYLLAHLRGEEPCHWCMLSSHGNEQACGGHKLARYPRGLHGWLRKETPHFRGCWALDRVLGRG